MLGIQKNAPKHSVRSSETICEHSDSLYIAQGVYLCIKCEGKDFITDDLVLTLSKSPISLNLPLG